MSLLSINSWFVSERRAKLNNDESCWLIFDEYLFSLFKFPMTINGDGIGLWTNNDDVDDDAVGILIRLDNGVNSTDDDLFEL